MLTARRFAGIPLAMALVASGPAGVAAGRAGEAGGDGQAELAAPASYEAAAEGARPTRDVATLLSAFVDRCDGPGRDLERARCRVTQSYLRRVLPRRTFVTPAHDATAIAVSEYDAGVRGYRIALNGCLACTKPISVGRAGERRFVTLRLPDKESDNLPKAVEIARGSVGFDGVPEARRWLDGVRPLLRAEFVFQPTDVEWSFGPSRGYALKLVAARIYNRCTGEVIVSTPPSVGLAERPPGGREEPGCGVADTSVPRAPGASEPDLPEELTKPAIADAMSKIRPQVFACFEQYRVPGNAQLDYVVAGNGMVQSIHVGGAFDGTATGACVLDAGKNARFPRFKAPRQTFSYPFFLRR